MIKYQLFDDYGHKVHEHTEDATDCGTVILCHNGRYFRPISYDIYSEPNTAKCIPVHVIDCR